MNEFTKTLAAAALVTSAMSLTVPAYSAEAIAGNWRTQSGETASIAKCGSAYCITLKTGKYAGKRIGRMKGKGNSYSGTITDPTENKKYSGSAKISGSSMKMRGCALKIFCKTQSWKKL